MFGPDKQIKQQLKQLETHLQNESPLLIDAINVFRKLDRIAYSMGLLKRDQSFATQIPWWPLISVLGTFSAGKSTFINHYLGHSLQETGTQAVDDKFTVICYTSDDKGRVLPGISLDADPRFPFYRMADEIDRVVPGEGDRVNAYLQMRTCPSKNLKGNIIIDSPGFDADAQRTAILKITDYIVELSDLVLVFFDARHPEPGAMRDTLKHLVADKVFAKNSEKFVYVLNQIDASAREDNPEDVVASWQRALAGEGLTAGKFYTIYNPDVAVPIEDDALRERFERKRDEDLSAIYDRMSQLNVERLYRIIGSLDKTAREIEFERLPKLRSMLRDWRQGTLIRDLLMSSGVALIVFVLLYTDSFVSGMLLSLFDWIMTESWSQLIGFGSVVAAFSVGHYFSRKWAASSQLKKLKKYSTTDHIRDSLENAFRKNTFLIHSIFRPQPVGWGYFSKKSLKNVVSLADQYIQSLNDQFAKPSGDDDLKSSKESSEIESPEEDKVELDSESKSTV
jgi:hypothetical protein